MGRGGGGGGVIDAKSHHFLFGIILMSFDILLNIYAMTNVDLNVFFALNEYCGL